MSYGLMLIAVNLLYLGFSLLVGFAAAYLVYKITKKRKVVSGLVFVISFLTVLLAPFYDLIIQKSIKTYYETYKMDDTIYAYPEKDENGKIESLGIDNIVDVRSLRYLTSEKDFKRLKTIYPVNNFIECYIFGSFLIDDDTKERQVSFEYSNDLGYTRINLRSNNISYKKISSLNDFTARYQVIGTIEKHSFYEKYIVKFLDKKKNVLLAQGFELRFPSNKNNFRSKFLLWKSANGINFQIIRVRNHHDFFEKLFGFSINTSKI